MKSVAIAISALFIAAPSSPAFAKLGFVPVKIITGGPEGGYPGTQTCETESWGNEQQGGYEEVCAGSDGSSSWKTVEWVDGVVYEDSGSVQMQGSSLYTSTTSSSESSSSSVPLKFRASSMAK